MVGIEGLGIKERERGSKRKEGSCTSLAGAAGHRAGRDPTPKGIVQLKALKQFVMLFCFSSFFFFII